MFKQLLTRNPLFVFALEQEAGNHFSNVRLLFTGVGKINAAYRLTKEISGNKPDIIVNLGSAGSNVFERGAVVCCTRFVQRDMDAAGIGCEKYETPFSNIGPNLDYGIEIDELPKGICGTGDNFEIDHSVPDYNVVDMEAYSLAYIAAQEQIPFLCLKYISDGADEGAAEDWTTMVEHAANALKQVVDRLMPQLI